jgi:hypothetical protein
MNTTYARGRGQSKNSALLISLLKRLATFPTGKIYRHRRETLTVSPPVDKTNLINILTLPIYLGYF